LSCCDRGGHEARRRNVEGRVAEPETEGVERCSRVEEIAAARGWLVIVIDRQLPDRAGDGYRQLAARIDLAEQDVGDPMPSLLTKIPAFDHRRRFLGKIIDGQRAAVEQHNDGWLVQCEN